MANEIQVDYDSGNTLYAVIRSWAGQVWYIAGQAFEDWGAGGHGPDDYDIALADKSGDRYVGSFDANVPAGRYAVQVFAQAGASPAAGDAPAGSSEIVWTGSAELTCEKVLANKAVQDKVTGAVSYYDDDGTTVILKHAVSDTAASLVRTPE